MNHIWGGGLNHVWWYGSKAHKGRAAPPAAFMDGTCRAGLSSTGGGPWVLLEVNNNKGRDVRKPCAHLGGCVRRFLWGTGLHTCVARCSQAVYPRHTVPSREEHGLGRPCSQRCEATQSTRAKQTLDVTEPKWIASSKRNVS